VREQLTLVIARTSPVKIVAPYGRLKRRRDPFGKRVGRLYIVMPVD